LDLVASIQLSVQRGVGALPQATIGTVSPGDPMASKAKTMWGTTPQATAVAPAWAPAATMAAPGTGTSLQRGATMNHATPLRTQQPAAPATAPSSLEH
jgi:hypothetical protein